MAIITIRQSTAGTGPRYWVEKAGIFCPLDNSGLATYPSRMATRSSTQPNILLIMLMVGVICLGAMSASADIWYVATNSPADGPGTAWSNAWHVIQDAVDAASSNDTVLVTNGVYDVGGAVTPGYSLSNRVCITNAITLQSVNGPEVTVIRGAAATGGGNGTNAVRGVYMSAGVLSGFTVTNGHTMTSGDFSYDRRGGGVNMYGGDAVVTNCTLTGNSAAHRGGGSYYGTLNNCTLSDNSAIFGGGSRASMLSNCTLTGNSADYGGGSSYGTLNNCTLTGNSADYGGGSRDGTLNNCIVYHNHARIDGDNYSGGTFSYCCTTSDPGGTGNITNDPVLVSASHIHADSPCVGAGSASYTSGTDVDGEAWASPPSMGCDEPLSPFSGELDVAIAASYTNVVVGYELPFTGQIHGVPASNRWTFGDGGSLWNAVYVQHTWSGTGDYPVVLTAWNNDHPAGVSATVFVHVVVADYHYVDGNNPSPASPYAGWATAATNIQDAVSEAGKTRGSTVWVTNGVYDAGTTVTPGHACNNRVVITHDIVVRSVNGPEGTVIQGAAATGGGNGVDAVRGVYMSAGVLFGFTVTNGHTMTSGYGDYDMNGGGVNLYGSDAVVTNCTLSGNSAYDVGGGCYDGTLNNCTLSGNSAYYGGGCRCATLNNCTLSGNSAYYGGGSDGGTLNNCTLSGNSAADDGGGSFSGTLNNCTLTGNSADYGGGSCYGTLNNCIVYHNHARIGGDNYSGWAFSYCCTTPDPGGTGNITNDPVLVSASHIHADSPCVGAGSAGYTSGTDVDGEAWALPPSMGCDEPLSPFSGELDVSIAAHYTNVVLGYELAFMGNILGEPASNRWTFGDGGSLWNAVYTRHAWSGAGDYPVVLTSWNNDYPAGVTATVLVHVVNTSECYVDRNNPSPTPPYAGWATAATNIQDAVNEAGRTPGSTVWVTNGVYDTGTTVTPGYACSNRVVITDDIVVRSVNGPDVTVIQGAAATGGGNGTNAVRGVYMSAGVLSGFTVTNGHTMTSGDLRYNRSGGGVNMRGGDAVLANCTLAGNSADVDGGGSYRGTLNNCTLSGNSAADDGGGSYYGALNNCTLSGNLAHDDGGGSYYGTLNNCTLSDNSAGDTGGGSFGGTLNNCIVYDNHSNMDGDNYSGGTFSYCCTTPGPGGTSNITDNPQFVDATNFRLRYGSPCIDAGSNGYVVGTTDLDGNARIVDGDTNGAAIVDMGAYEYDRAIYDSDGDGLVDGDELDTYGTSPTNVNTDGDCFADYDEVIADTDGSDPTDYFRILTIKNDPRPAVIFDSSSNRWYVMEGCSNLLDGVWTNVPGAGPRKGVHGRDEMEDTNEPPKGPFYRLEVEMLP